MFVQLLLLPVFITAQSDVPILLQTISCDASVWVGLNQKIQACVLPQLQSGNIEHCNVIRIMNNCFYELASCVLSEPKSFRTHLERNLVMGYMKGVGPVAESQLNGCTEAEAAKTFLMDRVLGGSQCELYDSLDKYLNLINCQAQSETNYLREAPMIKNAKKKVKKLCNLAESIELCSGMESWRKCMNPKLQMKVEAIDMVTLQDKNGVFNGSICDYVRSGNETDPRLEQVLGGTFTGFKTYWHHFKIIVKSPDVPTESASPFISSIGNTWSHFTYWPTNILFFILLMYHMPPEL